MSARPSSPARPAPSLVALALAVVPLLVPAAASAGEPARLTVLERVIAQDQGSWRIDYRLRYEGPAPVVVTPSDLLARVEGWVSNSRVDAHATPRWSSVVVSSASNLANSSDVIASSDEEQQCRERLVVRAWTGKEPPAEPAAKAGARNGPAVPSEPTTVLNLEPGDAVRVRLRLEHQHFLFGDYDPLLGHRTVELRLGPASLQDSLPIDREQYFALPKCASPAPPAERRDTHHFISAPDSLHIEAHVPGNQSYRFPERPVRYATKMRLSFWYLVAPGTEDECRARITQYKDSPTSQRSLSAGGREVCLKRVGRWTRVEQVFRTEPEATTIALDFRICGGAEVGEMWIDDVSLEPVGNPSGGP